MITIHRPTRRGFLTSAFAAGGAYFTQRGLFAQALTLTPAQTEGPYYPNVLPLDRDNDLLIINDNITPAVGTVAWLGGRVLDRTGQPVRNALVEIWQADNVGSYIHTQGALNGNRDGNFQGYGRFETASDGQYLFRTIKPGLYPGRVRHVHAKITLPGGRSLTTQLYIEGETGNDGVLNGVPAAQRSAVIKPWTALAGSSTGALAVNWDVVMDFTPPETPTAARPVLVAAGGVAHGANLRAGAASGSWVTLFGTGLADTTRVWTPAEIVNGRLPQQLDDVSVRINGRPASIYYISPRQLNVLAPEEQYRTLAATSISDPRIISLPGTQEFLEPLMEQFYRGAGEPERRGELVGPLLKLFTRARWNLPKTDEQQSIFYRLLLPKFAPERGSLEENTRVPLQMEKDSLDWYVARSLAGVVHANPDLQTGMLLRQMPTEFKTPMDEAFWLPAAGWIFRYGLAIPEVGQTPAGAEVAAAEKDRLAALFVRTLEASKVDPRLRGAVNAVAADVAVRTHPKITPALRKARPNLFEADPPEAQALDAAGKANWEYFKNWVAPELQRANRDDQLSCLGCHAVPGRVPSMELAGTDNSGYMSPKDAWRNYKILTERVNEAANVESSKLLRKPLNVQSGKEDGHQGGRRYNPNDRGYEILRRWVLDVAKRRGGAASTSGQP